jgi:hypothetical protein
MNASCKTVDHRRIAMRRRGHHGGIERAVAAARARAAMRAEPRDRLGHEPVGRRADVAHPLRDDCRVHRIVRIVPAIEVGRNRDERIAELGFARELRLRHRAHADHGAAPLAVQVRFGARRELRAFRHDVGAAVLRLDVDE